MICARPSREHSGSAAPGQIADAHPARDRRQARGVDPGPTGQFMLGGIAAILADDASDKIAKQMKTIVKLRPYW